MVEKQQKLIFLHSAYNARNNGYEQVFSYQIVSLAVTENWEETKQSAMASHCVDCHYFA